MLQCITGLLKAAYRAKYKSWSLLINLKVIKGEPFIFSTCGAGVLSKAGKVPLLNCQNDI